MWLLLLEILGLLNMSVKQNNDGFKVNESKIRDCINSTCKKKFLSLHNGHRQCKACERREDNTGNFGEVHKVHI